MKRISIKGRILIWFLLVQSVLAVAGSITVLAYVRTQQLKAFDAELDARMEALIANIEPSNGKLQVYQPDSIPPKHLFVVLDSKGRTIAQKGLDRLIPVTESQKVVTFAHDGKPYRGLQRRSFELLGEDELKAPPRIGLLYAMPLGLVNARFYKTILIVATTSVAFIFLSALGTWWAVAKGLWPLDQFAHRAAAIDASNWLFEVPEQASATSELVPLASALLQMMERLKAAFDRERIFLSDASHELKTSVAIQKSTLQLLEQGTPTLSEYKQGVARALEDTGRTEQLVASMLRLGASEFGKTIERTSALADSLDAAIRELGAMAEALHVMMIVQGSTAVDVHGDPGELKVVFNNVLENALQHSPTGSHVEVEVRTGTNRVDVSIADSGAGIPAEDLPHIFERFYRVDHSRARKTGGFGLGLAIAKSLVERNHGRIEIQSAPGGGTRVIIRLTACLP